MSKTKKLLAALGILFFNIFGLAHQKQETKIRI